MMDEPILGRVGRREPPSVELTRLLLEYLLSGRFQPGDRIPSERQLSESLSVGRSAVRDALRPLTAFGLLETRIGDGTYLSDPQTNLLPRLIEWGMLVQEQQVLDLIEVRWHMEVVTVRLAAERRNEKDVADLREALAALAAAENPEDFSRLDTAFHLRIAEASGNTVLFAMLDRLQTLLRVWILRIQKTSPRLKATYDDHVPIMDAIAAGDPELAAAAMAAHLTGATERLRATFENAASVGSTKRPPK
jgi:GntR family transcriptional repressor for pyruvate dehydrogenase complex